MKIKTGVTVYQCDHCKRKMFRKHAMEFHEKWCSKNPENEKACSSCKHLKETTIETYFDAFDGERMVERKAFKCTKLDKLVYPLCVERRGLDNRYETFDEQEPMPKECEHKETGW